MTAPRTPTGVRRRRILLTAVMAAIALCTPGALPLDGSSGVAEAGTIGKNDWLGSVNAYRTMSGLPPVSVQPAWDAGTRQHSCYMLANGIAHDEIPGRPGYTAEGDAAGNASNVAMAASDLTSPQDFIGLWMTAPYHALGMLRPGWTHTSYGECRQPSPRGNMIAGASIDVIRGLNSSTRLNRPVVFPGNGATVPLYRFVAEYPNPVSACGWSGAAGLPLIAAMPADFSAASSTLHGPNGQIATCTLHKNNTSGLAHDLLAWDKAVIVMPRQELQDGRYTVSVQTSSGAANWSFNVKRDGGLSPGGGGSSTNSPTPTTKPPIKIQNTERMANGTALKVVEPYRQIDTRKNQGTTRLRANQVRRVFIASRSVEAVTANFTAVNPSGPGHLKVFDCGATPPNTSVLNYAPGRAAAGLATVGLDSGALCFLTPTDVDLIMDITGLLNDDAGGLATYTSIKPQRAFDSRRNGTPIRKNRPVKIDLTPGVVPNGALAVTANITVTQPAGSGHISIHPCKEKPTTSSVNYLKGETIANQAVVTLGTEGEMCVSAHAKTELIVDVTGYFAARGGMTFSPLKPIRLFDSRTTQKALNSQTGGQRARKTVRLKASGTRGIPQRAKSVALSIAAVDPESATHVTVYPCDQKMPNTSTLNVDPAKLVASNSAVVQLSGSGEVCITPLKPTHLIVDVYGIWE